MQALTYLPTNSWKKEKERKLWDKEPGTKEAIQSLVYLVKEEIGDGVKDPYLIGVSRERRL